MWRRIDICTVICCKSSAKHVFMLLLENTSLFHYWILNTEQYQTKIRSRSGKLGINLLFADTARSPSRRISHFCYFYQFFCVQSFLMEFDQGVNSNHGAACGVSWSIGKSKIRLTWLSGEIGTFKKNRNKISRGNSHGSFLKCNNFAKRKQLSLRYGAVRFSGGKINLAHFDDGYFIIFLCTSYVAYTRII